MAIELPAVCLVQTSNPVDVLILPSVADKNQPVPDLMGVTNSQKFSINEVDLGLGIYSVCGNLPPSILPTVVPVLKVGGDSTFWDPKNILN